MDGVDKKHKTNVCQEPVTQSMRRKTSIIRFNDTADSGRPCRSRKGHDTSGRPCRSRKGHDTSPQQYVVLVFKHGGGQAERHSESRVAVAQSLGQRPYGRVL